MSENKYLKQVESGVIKTDEAMIKDAEEDLKLHEDTLVLMDAEKKLKIESVEIIEKNPRPLPSNTNLHEFHLSDEFWDNQNKIRRIMLEKELVGMDQQRRQLVKVIEAKRKNVAELKGGKNE